MRFCFGNKQRAKLMLKMTTRHKPAGHKRQIAGKIPDNPAGRLGRDLLTCIRAVRSRIGILHYFARIRINGRLKQAGFRFQKIIHYLHRGIEISRFA
jgi:hypothetical protein